jgi:DNA-directed RNA polymerase specialized sigma24 family protein
MTETAFDRLLAHLSSDRDAAAHEYQMIRCRLVDFFDGRGADSAEALADEALDRVARKLDEGEVIDHVRAYVFGVAKMVSMEAGRRARREEAALEDLARLQPADDASQLEARIACLGGCVAELPEESRLLITDYYKGAGDAHIEDRKVLAQRLGLPYATLKTRAYRIRERLEECLRRCLGEEKPGNR